jgi:hypothetical protein
VRRRLRVARLAVHVENSGGQPDEKEIGIF